ncbi:hypothetical protein QVD17_07842 [Tagetes erecta]|uniref:Uncharacterized protein n=1 Tax=Tagetes erecta TaxID=13708 RepID=A0AAD8NX32_TARER|nr:hypothetical protein QVD17_07842 [Tagetes erecta]
MEEIHLTWRDKIFSIWVAEDAKEWTPDFLDPPSVDGSPTRSPAPEVESPGCASLPPSVNGKSGKHAEGGQSCMGSKCTRIDGSLNGTAPNFESLAAIFRFKEQAQLQYCAASRKRPRTSDLGLNLGKDCDGGLLHFEVGQGSSQGPTNKSTPSCQSRAVPDIPQANKHPMDAPMGPSQSVATSSSVPVNDSLPNNPSPQDDLIRLETDATIEFGSDVGAELQNAFQLVQEVIMGEGDSQVVQ